MNKANGIKRTIFCLSVLAYVLNDGECDGHTPARHKDPLNQRISEKCNVQRPAFRNFETMRIPSC
jgi:hypothetical protein